MSILRSARLPAVNARVALASSSSVRYLSTSAIVRGGADPLPSRNWGSSSPSQKETRNDRPASRKPQTQVPSARNWGAAPAPPPARDWGSGASKAPAARNWGTPADSASPRLNNRGNSGRGGDSSRGNANSNNNNDNNNSNRFSSRRDNNNAGGNTNRRGGFGLKRDVDAGGNRGGQNNRSGGSAALGVSRDWTPRKDNSRGGQGRDKEPAPSRQDWKSRGDRNSDRPARASGGEQEVDTSSGDYDVPSPSSRWADDEGDSRRGRWREGSKGSHSLLRRSDAELPSTHHHSTKSFKEDRGRQWALEDDQAELLAMEEAEKADRIRKDKARARDEARARKAQEETEKGVFIPASISVSQLADKFGVKLIHLVRVMNKAGMPENQRRADYLLNADEASNLAIEFNLNPIIDEDKGYDIHPEPEADISTSPLRPPVVTIMGHVDHGKTTLLDSLRNTQVAAGEAGGITQHIAAFSVPLTSLMKGADVSKDATVTFLDTPGHAAFTGMRARGALVTDLIVLVVAADDGVMPQTKEVIELVKAAGDSVGLVVAINKCDKPMIDIDRVKSNLGAEGILLEEDGGEVPSVRVSGLTGMGLDDLMETLSTLAEVRDLRARSEGKAEGYVLESHVDKGQGVITTVLVTRGTLMSGASIVAGNTWARVRQMTDSNGRSIRKATPGMPVTLTGWKSVPTAGDMLLEAPNDDRAKKAITNRLRDAERRAMAKDVEQVNERREQDRARAELEAAAVAAAVEKGINVTQALHAARRASEAAASTGYQELRLVIKGDVTGTIEAVVGSVQDIGNKEAGVKIVHTGVGDVSESDIDFAEATGATVIGFNVQCPRPMKTLAASGGVPVHCDSVIYRLIETVRQRVSALLPPKIEYRTTGEATVQQIFEITLDKKKTKKIAGSKVTNGVISKNEGVRVLRGPNRDIIFEGEIDTLKQLKKDATQIRKGTECGIGLDGFSDMEVGDEIVTFTKHEVPRQL